MRRAVALAMLSLACAVAFAACSAAPPSGGGASRPPGLPTGAPGAPGASATAAPAPPQPGQSMNACSLLSDDEVEQITGRSIATKESRSVMGIFDNGCSWELDPGRDDLVGWTIDVGVRSPGGRSYFDTFLSLPEDTEPISGLGDVAVTDGAGGISAVKGDTLISVFVIAFSADDEEALTRLLTETALSHVQ